jgi:hypothetical protein
MAYRQELRGWQAVVVAVGLVAGVGYQCARRIRTVDEGARFAIGVSLTREYMGTDLKSQVQQYLREKASHSAPAEPPVSATPIPNVEVLSVAAHGSADVQVAKVEVSVNGGPPPDRRSVRYLDLMRSVDGRWMVVADSDAYHYMRSLFSPALPNPYR